MTEKLPNQPPEQFDPPTGADFIVPDFIDATRGERADAARIVGNLAEVERLQQEVDEWTAESKPDRGRRVQVDLINGPDTTSVFPPSSETNWASVPDDGYDSRHAAAKAERARLMRSEIATKTKAAEEAIIAAYEKEFNTDSAGES